MSLLSKDPKALLRVLAAWGAVVAVVALSNPSPRLYLLGLAVAALGEGTRLWAAGHLVRDSRLATGGPYAYTRNPLYLGRLLLILGFSAMAGGVVGICLLAVGTLYFFAYYLPRKERREPKRLHEVFGEEYDRYRKAVPALLPRLTPYEGSTGRWTFGTFLVNREHLTLIALAVAAAIIGWRAFAP